MKISQIAQLFRHEITIGDFHKLIVEEVEHYRILTDPKKGGSIPIILQEDEDIHVGPGEIILIINGYLKDYLSTYDVYYIMDALLLSGKVSFENEEFLEIIETLTDPEINGYLTKDIAKKVMQQVIAL